jgi:hypothetical protein
MRISLVSFADHSFTVKAPNLKWSSCTVRPASVALPVIMFQELEIFTGFTFDETKMHPKLYRNKATPPRAATCMPRTHSGNMATYVPLPQGVGQNVVFGTCLGRENLIRVLEAVHHDLKAWIWWPLPNQEAQRSSITCGRNALDGL